MPIIKLKNYSCNFKFINNHKDKTIIFSNSLGTTYNMWNDVVEIISNEYNIILHETRGHGKSTNTKKELTIEELGEDIIELIGYLNISSLTFCGLSMGGLIGQYLGINHPDKFNKIIIANTASKIGNEQGWNDRIDYVSNNGLDSILDGTAERWFTTDFRNNHPEIVSGILNEFKNNDLVGYCANCAAVRDANFQNEIQKIKSPTLIISGTDDLVTTIEDGDYMNQKIQNSKHVHLKAAHLSAVELANEFASNILNF
ncbi:3-oxoadipate enol-lactonase [Chishuiella sp.]|uniref:3-oxoadipate enol-lactonase n=1 Tax=Chishuiella sp. TaxID=1969467 RepID=UPI0028B143A2|nr:3-oxoadipate enol-lactonase [Chishuiella sp.]